MKIVVKLTDQAASELTKNLGNDVFASRFKELLAQHHTAFEIMHPDASDKTLQSYLTLTTPDSENAEVLTKELLATDGILAAYVKPEDQAP